MSDPLDDLVASPSELGVAARASQEPELAPLPTERPFQTQDRVAKTQVFKAKNLASAGLPTWQDANGIVQPVADATGTPLTSLDRKNSIAYDATGNPQRVGYDASGAPVLSDPLADAPVVSKKDLDGRYSLYKAPRGLPWQWQKPDAQKNAVLDEKEARTATRQAATALGGQLSRDHAEIVRGQALIKASKKRMLADVPIDPALLGDDPKAISGDPKAVHAAIDQHFDSEYAQPGANEKAGWFSKDLSPAAQSLRTTLDQSKARAHQRADELFAHQETVNQKSAVREQRESIQTDLKTRELLDAAKKAGLVIPGLDDLESSQSLQSPSDQPSLPQSDEIQDYHTSKSLAIPGLDDAGHTTVSTLTEPELPQGTADNQNPSPTAQPSPTTPQFPESTPVGAVSSPPSTATPTAVQPESALGSVLRPLVSHGFPALATAGGGLAAGTLAVPTGPGAFAADIAGGAAASYLAEKIQTKLMGPEWKAQQEAQLTANRDPKNPDAHPTAAAIGEFIPAVLSMLGGSAGGIKQVGKTLTQQVGRWLGHTVEATAAKPAYLARALGALPESMTLGARMGAGSAAQGMADGHGDLGDVLEQAGKGAVTMGPVVFGPPAGTLLGNVLGKAPSDAAILSFSNALYEKLVHGADINPEAIFEEGETSLPGFMILNGLTALTHGSPFFRTGRPPEAPAGQTASPAPTEPSGSTEPYLYPKPSSEPITSEAIQAGEPEPLSTDAAIPKNTQPEKNTALVEPTNETPKDWNEGPVEALRAERDKGLTAASDLEKAREVVAKEGKLSVSLLQRRLRWGYAQAKEIHDQLKAENETPSEVAPPDVVEQAAPEAAPAGEEVARPVQVGEDLVQERAALVEKLATPPASQMEAEMRKVEEGRLKEIDDELAQTLPSPKEKPLVPGLETTSGETATSPASPPSTPERVSAPDSAGTSNATKSVEDNAREMLMLTNGDHEKAAVMAEGYRLPEVAKALREQAFKIPGVDIPTVETKQPDSIASKKGASADAGRAASLVPGLETETEKPKTKPAEQPPEPPKTSKKAPPTVPEESKQRVQLKSGPQTYTVEEALPAQKGDQPGERYFRVKNERTGEEQTVEKGDIKPLKTDVLPSRPETKETPMREARVDFARVNELRSKVMNSTNRTEIESAKIELDEIANAWNYQPSIKDRRGAGGDDFLAAFLKNKIGNIEPPKQAVEHVKIAMESAAVDPAKPLPKDVRDEALAQLEAELEKAPSEESLSESQRQSIQKDSIAKQDQGKRQINEATSMVGSVTVDIPGDGKFTIIRTKEAIQEAIDRLKKLSAQPKFGAPSTGGGVGRTEPEIQGGMMVEGLGKKEAVAELERQLAQTKSATARTMIEKTLEVVKKATEPKPKSEAVSKILAGLKSKDDSSRNEKSVPQSSELAGLSKPRPGIGGVRKTEANDTAANAGTKQKESNSVVADGDNRGRGEVSAKSESIEATEQPKASLAETKPEPTDTHERIVAHIAETQKLAPHLDVEVVRSEKDLPPEVRERMADGIHEGIYDAKTKKIWLFSENLGSVERAEQVFAHEAIGHHGIEGVVRDADWTGIEDSVFSSPRAQSELIHIALEYVGKKPIDLSESERRTVTREYIARLAENPQINYSLWRSILMAVKKALRRMGIRRNWSLDELHDLVRQSARSLGADVVHHSELQSRRRDGTFREDGDDIRASFKWRETYDKAAKEVEAAGHEWNSRKARADIAGGNDAVENVANYEGGKVRSKIRLDFPEEKDDIAARVVIEAGGSLAELKADREKVSTGKDPKRVKEWLPIFDHAIENFDRLDALRVNHDQVMADSHARLKAAGEDVGEVKDYVRRITLPPPGVVDDLPRGLFEMGNGMGRNPKNITKERSFAKIADAAHEGYDPGHKMRLSDLDASRVELGERIIERKKFLRQVAMTPAPRDGKPIIGELEPRNTLAYQQRVLDWNANGQKGPHPKQEMSTPAGYTIVQTPGGGPMPIHNDFAPTFKALFGQSAIRNSTVGRILLKGAAILKTVGLAGDTYHIGRVIYKMGIGGGGRNIENGRALIEYAPEDLARAVKAGEVTQEQADYANKHRANFQRLLRHGMNVGRAADNLYEQAHLNLPGIGKLNNWIFNKLSRAAMAQTALRYLETNLAKPEFKGNESAAFRQTAIEANEAFGNLGNQGIFKSKTMQDIARLIFLAPQWVESQASNEFRAYAQAGKTVVNAARGKGVSVGNTTRAFAIGGVALLAVNQVINYLSRGHSTFENEEDGHGLDAFIPFGKHGGWFNPTEIVAENLHMAMRYAAQHENSIDVATHIASNKLSSMGRALKEAATGRDFSGRPFLNNSDRATAVVSDLLPLPISAGGFFEKDPRQPLGYRVNRQPGSVTKQALQSFGLKVANAQSPRSQIFALAKPFRADRGGMDSAGEFTELRRALDNDDMGSAAKEIAWLQKRGKSIDAIKHSVGVMKSGDIHKELFTGGEDREKAMLKTLTPKELKIYGDAQTAHRQNALKLLRLIPSLPRTAPPRELAGLPR